LANLIDISKSVKRLSFLNRLSRIIQSTNLNFLIGSGCSNPAIKDLGNKEKEISEARKKGEEEKANQLMHDFLLPFLDNTKLLIDNNITIISDTINIYKSFIRNIYDILFNRKNNILPSQAIVFSTNYDLFIEYAMNDFNENLLLCDGFKRTSNINKDYYFSSTEYFNSVFNTGNLYRYKVEIPTINLIKLHGSLNWFKNNNKIIQSFSHIEKAEIIKNSKEPSEIKLFNSLFNIVLPQDNKLQLTTLDEIYYDLLRIYSNELDKENTVLLADGFSFEDQHIREITIRALKNKTFNLIIFAYNENDKYALLEKFKTFKNVDIVFNGNKKLDFKQFNQLLAKLIFSDEDDA